MTGVLESVLESDVLACGWNGGHFGLGKGEGCGVCRPGCCGLVGGGPMIGVFKNPWDEGDMVSRESAKCAVLEYLLAVDLSVGYGCLGGSFVSSC